jgi:hypothetical protein
MHQRFPLVDDDDDGPMRHVGAHPPAWLRTAQDDMGAGERPQATLAPFLPRRDKATVVVVDGRRPEYTRKVLQILYIVCQRLEMRISNRL